MMARTKIAELPTRRVSPLDERKARAKADAAAAIAADRSRLTRVVAGVRIDCDVPMPQFTGGRSSAVLEALADLKPGESIFRVGHKTSFVPGGIRKRFPDRFYFARHDEVAGKRGIRIWRKN